MREEFKDEGWRDFQQRYQGTFGWYEKANKEKLLVQLIEVDSSRCKFSDKDGAVFTALSDKGNHFEFLPVKKGLYLTDNNDVISCKRVPAKQYKRGIAETNTSLTYLSSGMGLEVCFEVLEQMFEPQQRNDSQRVNLFMNHDVLVHNNIFALTGGKVFVYDHNIGTYSFGERSITLHNNLFKQEIDDMIAALKLPFVTVLEG